MVLPAGLVSFAKQLALMLKEVSFGDNFFLPSGPPRSLCAPRHDVPHAHAADLAGRRID
jgi:hypothetical protein